MTTSSVPHILHVDMDAFFVSVELLDQPELRGQPVIVGGAGERGVVAAASYEARAFGVHSAMPSVRARRLCPQAIFLRGRYERSAEESEAVMSIFHRYTPLVEPISLDEAFLDVGAARRLHGDGPSIGAKIRTDVLDERGLTCSVGVAPTKFVAKLASEAAKPKSDTRGPQPGLGVKVVTEEEVLGFLHPLPVRALWGVGPATLKRLERFGVTTVGDLAALPIETLTAALGSAHGQHLHELANGIDERSVEPDRKIKSISHEETFAHDRHDRASLEREITRFADAIAGRLRKQDLVGRTVSIKVRFHDFRTITRASTLGAATDAGLTIAGEARGLLGQVDPSPGVRLLGVSVSGLSDGSTRQLTFDELATGPGRGSGAPGGPAGRPRSASGWDTTNRTIDEIRDRFGVDAIGPAAIAAAGSGLQVKRKGSQQWGPDADKDRDGGTGGRAEPAQPSAAADRIDRVDRAGRAGRADDEDPPAP